MKNDSVYQKVIYKTPLEGRENITSYHTTSACSV